MKALEVFILIIWVFFLLVVTPITFFAPLFFAVHLVNEYETIIVFRYGKLKSGYPKGPGLYFIIPVLEKCFIVDKRVVSIDVPTQETLTKDAVSVQVDAVVYFRVIEPLKASIVVKDYHINTYLLAMTMLRNIIGSKKLNEILAQRAQLQEKLLNYLDLASNPWGVKIERVEIKDVRIPSVMQRVMAAEAQAIQEARAKLISAEGEFNSAQALKEAANIMSKCPATLQLKYLHVLNAISTENNRLIIFPTPTELIKKLSK